MPPLPFKAKPKMPPLPFAKKEVKVDKPSDEIKIESKDPIASKMPPLPFKKKEEIKLVNEKVGAPEGYEENDDWLKPLSEEYVSRWSKP